MHITIASMDANGEISGGVLDAAKRASFVVLQTEISDRIKNIGVKYETLDSVYESASDFDDLVDKSVSMLKRDKLLFIAICDLPSNKIAVSLAKSVTAEGGSVSVIPGGDRALCMALEEGFASALDGVSIFTAASFTKAADTDLTLVINEIDTRLLASELKIRLLKYYDNMHNILFSDIRGNLKKKIPISMLDCEQSYGYYTSIVVAPCGLENKLRYTFSDLVSVMDRLRSKDGCPWDREQTHESLKRYLVEESYEVIEAIDDGDTEALYDELGDVLLQVAFHSKIADQCGEFDISDVTTAICSKMISRHTHIFGSAVAKTAKDVLKNWEQIKKNEKGQRSQTEVLLSVPKSMPALMRSEKVQYKAARSGMDFPGVAEAICKLKEEISEVEQCPAEDIIEECGDLLFSAVNVSRLMGVEPETALQKATDKFISRFCTAESYAQQRGIDMKTCSIDELNDIWDYAKGIK